MSSVAEAFRTGGVWMYLILLLQLIAFPCALVTAGLTFKRFRVPWIVWAILPLAIMLVLSAGHAVGIDQTMNALELATPETRQKLMARGIASSMNVEVFGGLCVWLTSLGGAFLLAVSTLLGTPRPRAFSPAPAGLAMGLGVLAALVVTGAGFALGAGTSANLGMGFMIVLAACCCALVCAMKPDDDAHMPRVASARIGVPILCVLALWGYANAHLNLSMIEVFNALEVATPQARLMLLALGFESVHAERIMGWLALLSPIGFGVFPALLTIKHALDKRGIISGVLAAVLVTGASLISFGVTYNVRDHMANQRIPTERWALQATIDAPTSDALPDTLPSHQRTPDTDHNGSCILHRTSSGWALSGVYEPGSVWDTLACQGDSGGACTSRKGPLDGPLCESQQGIGLLVPATTLATEFTRYAWGDAPRVMVLGVDTSIEDADISKVHPYMLPLVAGPVQGVRIKWHPPSTPQSEFSSGVSRDEQRGVYVLSTLDGVKEARTLEELDTLFIAHQKAGWLSRMVFAPSSKMTMQDVATICAMRRAREQSDTDHDPYAEREPGACNMIDERTAAAWTQ